ncbi:MAG: hypothetical protein IJF45_01350 [Clostridia bacterium]|nr:hypothetical protein [Clostridia bacterium]
MGFAYAAQSASSLLVSGKRAYLRAPREYPLSGKLPPPIIGGMRCYAKLHTMMAVLGFKAHASTITQKNV